jgi:LCP family protein required for cell wall assembly
MTPLGDPAVGQPYRRPPHPRWGRIALVVTLGLALVTGLTGLGLYVYARDLDSHIGRANAFSLITGPRPAVLAPGAMNVLLLGSDSRDPSNKAQAGSWRTDTIIVMHIQADHKHAYLISIPRDTYIYIPRSPTNPNLGNTNAKINAAFAWGGLPLTVQTVENFTHVRIDHVALIDFGGFQEVTDALGGVDMYVDQTITSIFPPHRVFAKGEHHFTGAEALDYVRQRYQFADGDITRERHQQAFLKAVMDRAAGSGLLTNPIKLNAFLQAVSRAIVVDENFSLTDMAYEYHGLRSSDLTFLTTPWSGFGTEGGESVVYADQAKDSALFAAVAGDRVATYLSGTPR